MPEWLKLFSYISPFTYSFQNYCKLEFDVSPYPAAQNMLAFLGIEREFWDGILILVGRYPDHISYIPQALGHQVPVSATKDYSH